MLRDLIIALSAANMAFIGVWSVIIYIDQKDTYLIRNLPTANSFLALIINELLFTIIFWLGIRLVRHFKKPVFLKTVKIIFNIIVIFFLGNITEKCFNIRVNGMSIPTIILVVLLIIALVKRKTFKSAVQISLIMSPLVFLVFIQSAWRIYTDSHSATDSKITIKSVESSNYTVANPRVVWLIFDRIDYRLAFSARPPKIKLPEIDRFRREALFATNAKEPGPQTHLSLPALTLGRYISDASSLGPNQLKITYQDTNQSEIWGAQPNIFTQLKDLKINTAISGWYHPYSRVFRDQVTYSDWRSMRYDYVSDNDTILVNMVQQIGGFVPWQDAQNQITNYFKILNLTQKLVTNPEFDLVFVHFPVPHEPYIYDEVNNRFTYIGGFKGGKGYFGNLVLADQTFGKIRKNMEEKQLWDNTTVIVSTDHSWHDSSEISGESDGRIPFIIKLAGQKEAIEYNSLFETVLSKNLILAILQKEIVTPRELVNWLDKYSQTKNP